MSLYLRAYEPHEARKPPKRVRRTLPKRVLVFDTETTTDVKQTFRVGRYDIYVNGRRIDGAFFYPEDLPDFRKLLEAEGMRKESAIIGFNLPFDIARVAHKYSAARGDMYGGFSFQLSPGSNKRIRTKHLGPHKTMFKWSGNPQPNGTFIDVSMLGAALLRPCSLAEMARRLKTKHQKLEAEHGNEIDAEYLRYLQHDVLVTYECYQKLAELWLSYGLEYTAIDKLYSEASIGKAALKQIGVEPFHSLNPGFPPEILGAAMEAFYGGRSEVHIRREPRRITHVDFLSMYPTVCALMGLWQYTIAKEIVYETGPNTVAEIEGYLQKVSLSGVLTSGCWRGLPAFVQILPDEDVLPLRSDYAGNGQASIGLNYLSAAKPIWYTLADCIVSVLLSGKVPKVVNAIRIRPKGKQTGLQSWAVMGKQEYTVDPYNGDFYVQLIQLRATTKGTVREALKYVANSTCYGIYAELNSKPNELGKREYHTGTEKRVSERRALEEPGTYHNPILAALITGAARLMLATLEKQVTNAGLDWCFCDTDSMCIAVSGSDDIARVLEMVKAYERISPYPQLKHILKVEAGGADEEPTFSYCISAKRYALYQVQGAKISIVKASAHGLGHLRNPDGTTGRKGNVPLWLIPVWEELVSSDGVGNHQPKFRDSTLRVPAMSQFTVTGPLLLRYGMNPYSFASVFRTNAANHKPSNCVAVANFSTSPIVACRSARLMPSNEPVARKYLQTYEEAIALYYQHPESKFEGGNGKGVLKRRHIKIGAQDVVYIGKEGTNIEESIHGITVRNRDYGTTRKRAMPERTYTLLPVQSVEKLQRACEVYGTRHVAKRIGLSDSTVRLAVRTGHTRKAEIIERALEGLVC